MQNIKKYLIILWLTCVAVVVVAQDSQFGPIVLIPQANWLSSNSSPTLADLEPASFPRVTVAPLPPDQALQTFESRGSRQNSELKGYTDQTLVMAELMDTSQRGAFELQRSYVAPRTLTFKPIHYTGDSFVKNNVITRILQSEVDYATRGNSAETALSAANYKFTFKGDQSLNGHAVHVFQVKPREKRAGLFKGRIYLDANTGNLARSEGVIVKSPSFFLRHIEFVEDYTDISGYTLPVQLHTTARARFVGRTVVDIYHQQYQPQPLAASLQASPAAGPQ